MATQHKPTGCARLLIVLLLVLPLTYMGASYYTGQDPFGIWKILGVQLGVNEVPTAPAAPVAPVAPQAPSAPTAAQAAPPAGTIQVQTQEMEQMKQELNFLRREVDLLKDEVKMLRDKSSKNTY